MESAIVIPWMIALSLAACWIVHSWLMRKVVNAFEDCVDVFSQSKRHRPITEPVYVPVADGTPHGGAKELIEGRVYADYDANGNLLGVEVVG